MNKFRRFFLKKFSFNILLSGIFLSNLDKMNIKNSKIIKKSKFRNLIWYLDKND